MCKPSVIKVPFDMDEVALKLRLQLPELKRTLEALDRAQGISRETLEKRCTI